MSGNDTNICPYSSLPKVNFYGAWQRRVRGRVLGCPGPQCDQDTINNCAMLATQAYDRRHAFIPTGRASDTYAEPPPSWDNGINALEGQ